MFKVEEIKNPQEWNKFLLNQPTQAGIFLQSWQWLDFQESLGWHVWREGVFEDGGRLLGLAAVIKYSLLFGKNYFYCPRGPILEKSLSLEKQRQIFAAFKSHWQKNKEGKFIFARFEPFANLIFEDNGSTRGYGSDIKVELNSLRTQRGRVLLAGARPSFLKQPEQTLLLDLTKEAEDILSAMHEKTRYNIRLASRRGVKVQISNSKSQTDFDNFLGLLKETAKRDKFKTHAERYYKKMMEVCHPESSRHQADGEGSRPNGRPAFAGDSSSPAAPQNDKFFIRLWLAYDGEEVAAGALVAYFGDTATYLHGASSYAHRASMAPHLLHWEIIKNAQSRGLKWYDFWGIDEKKWPGVTRFKHGFFAEDILHKPECISGRRIIYPGAFDLIFSRFWYKLYRLGRRIF